MGKDLNGKELGKGLFQRKDKRYEARIFFSGSKKPIILYGSNLRDLKKKRNLRVQELKSGFSVMDSNISVSKWFNQWMQLYNVPRLKATTIRNYTDGFARIEELVGKLKLKEVKPANIHYVITTFKRNGYKNVSIIHLLAILNLLLKRAVFYSS